MNDIEVGSKRISGYTTTMNHEQDHDSAVYGTKKNRSDDLVMRLLLAGNDCGAIIGKGGENLSRLRKEFNVDVQIPSGRTLSRVFMVTGHLDSCVCVINDILKKASKGPFPVGPDNAVEINLLVVNDLVGHILGKSGTKIKEIREQSDTKIKIYQECLPNSNERVVAIGSDQAENIEKCVRMIFDIFQNVQRVFQPHYYDPSNGIMKGMGIPDNNGYQSHEYGRNGASGGDFKNGSMGNDNSGNEFLEAKTETKITVSNNMCGAIIGKGGSNIREIRNQSGARITFSGELDDRVITIAGTQQQVQYAEQLLTRSCMHISLR